MADPSKDGAGKAAGEAVAASAAKARPKPPNPLFQMMGMPNYRPKLPSRNWLIFWTIVSAWTGGWLYDRREKKRIQAHWCSVVSHLKEETIPSNQMPRKVTIYLAAPPADGLLIAREHFHDYVKPILVSAGMDWEAEEGRREGDIRAGLAERIRKWRMLRGEESQATLDEAEPDIITARSRERAGIKEYEGVVGDIVIGRHTWKEYVRGLHEGWLGPLDPPPLKHETKEEVSVEGESNSGGAVAAPSRTEPEAQSILDDMSSTATTVHDSTANSSSDATDNKSESSSPPAEATETPPEQNPTKTPKKRPQPPPFISTADYSTATPSRNVPNELPPSAPIPIPHILGFLNTPIRIYRFFTRRRLADDIGRQVAAVCLATYRPYQKLDGSMASELDIESPDAGTSRMLQDWEQSHLLQAEEAKWHKSIRKQEREPDARGVVKEDAWLDDMVLDPRIAARMRRFELSGAQEKEAITEGKRRRWEKDEKDRQRDVEGGI